MTQRARTWMDMIGRHTTQVSRLTAYLNDVRDEIEDARNRIVDLRAGRWEAHALQVERELQEAEKLAKRILNHKKFILLQSAKVPTT